MKLIFTNDIGVNLDSANLMCYFYLKDYFDHEVWDVSNIFGRKGAVKNINDAISVDTIEEFEHRLTALTKEQKVVIITNMVERPWRRLAPIAKKLNVTVASTQKNNFFDILMSKAVTDFSIRMPVNKRLGGLVRKFRWTRTLYSKYKGMDVKYDYLIAAYNPKPETTKHFIKAHNVKYDEYLKNKHTTNPIGKKFILFIDCAMCYHPIDYAAPDPNFNVDHYLKQLNDYFDLIEKKFNLPIVISLHPVSYGRLTAETFGGRRITYGQTAQLIQHCEFSISHFSTSLINVVLAKKPALILSSKEIVNSHRNNAQIGAFSFATMCGFAVDSLDKPSLLKAYLNEERYDKFIKKYLVDMSRLQKSNGQIIQEFLKNIDKEGEK